MHDPRSFVTAFVLAATLGAAPIASALQIRSYVASYGNDANACTLAAPCRNFGVAIDQTTPDGEVVALDSAGYGSFSLSKSMTVIAPPGIFAGIIVTSPNGRGVSIFADASAVVVRLVGLTISGPGADVASGISAGIEAGTNASGSATLYVDRCSIEGFYAGIQLRSNLTTSGIISETRVSRNVVGIETSEVGGATSLTAERVRAENNSIGFNILADSKVSIRSSVISGNSNEGISISTTGPGNTTRVTVDDTQMFNNFNGIAVNNQSNGVSATALISNSVISGGGNLGVRADGINARAYISNTTITHHGNVGVFAFLGGEVLSRGNNTLEQNAGGNTFPGMYSAK